MNTFNDFFSVNYLVDELARIRFYFDATINTSFPNYNYDTMVILHHEDDAAKKSMIDLESFEEMTIKDMTIGGERSINHNYENSKERFLTNFYGCLNHLNAFDKCPLLGGEKIEQLFLMTPNEYYRTLLACIAHGSLYVDNQTLDFIYSNIT